MKLYGEAAGGRTVRARLVHPAPPPDSQRRPWPQRAVDLDVLGHVNNAVALEAVEEVLSGRRPAVVEVEYRDAIEPGDDVELLTAGDGVWLTVAGDVRVSARVAAAASPPEAPRLGH